MAFKYTDYQNETASEKTVLATVEAGQRLMGWTLVSGSVYSIPCAVNVLTAVEDTGVSLTAVASQGLITAGTYFFDRSAQVLYVQTSTSVNPNSRFIGVTYRFFFSNTPISLPWDLNTGFEVFWEPLIKASSQFGVEIDVINQASEAIEGSGTLTLYNDHAFWPQAFDNYIFENQVVKIYSFNRHLVVTDAKLIFTGYIQKKGYTTDAITLSLKDLLSDLKSTIPLKLISALNARTSSSVASSFQRMVLGRVVGHVLVGTDQTLTTGYPISGTLSLAINDSIVYGVGTVFTQQLNPNDSLVLGGTSYSIASIQSDTQLTLSSTNTTLTISGLAATVIADKPKRWQNRTYFIAGHPLRTPTTATASGTTISSLQLGSTKDMYAGDTLVIGTGSSAQTAVIKTVVNSVRVTLSTSLATVPSIGTLVIRPAVQNLRIDGLLLAYNRDYTVDPSAATVTLSTQAEANAVTIQQLTNTATFTNGSTVVTGSGFKGNLQSSTLVAPVGNATFTEVLSVDSDTQITLRSPWTFSTVTAIPQFKFQVASEKSMVSCDVLGRTIDGMPTGALIASGAGMIQTLLQDVGLGSIIKSSTFAVAITDAPQAIGMVLPASYKTSSSVTYRDTINQISKSIFGMLVQTNDFQLTYQIIQPNKTTAVLKLTEPDILTLEGTATSENMIQTAAVSYQNREYDYTVSDKSLQTAYSTSDLSTYILGTTISQTFPTLLQDAVDAQRLARRWTILLERSSGLITVTTKLQTTMLQVGDVIDLNHSKLFTRLGGTDNRRLLMIQKITKDGKSVSIEGVDLSNMFNRVCTFGSGVNQFGSATNDEKAYNGYFTDAFGMISNNPATFGLNIFY